MDSDLSSKMRLALDDRPVFVNCPTEILIEILSYLPVKSLLRFRSVCKEWNNLVRTPWFVNAHLKKSIRDSLLIVSCSDTYQESSFSLINADTFKRTPQIKLPIRANLGQKLSICGSCNGLVCISFSCLYDVYPIYLWNPSIRKAKKLPYGLIPKQDHRWALNYLAFAFHQALNDHIVVRIVRLENWSCCYQVEIYSLNADCWRRVSSIPPIPTSLDCKLSSKSVCFNGLVYWIVKHKSGGIPNSILSFDMATEEFHRLMLPDCLAHSDPSSLVCLGVAEESLSAFHCWSDDGKHPFDTWVLKMGSWVQLNTVVLPWKITRQSSLLDYRLVLLSKQIDGRNCNLPLSDLDLEHNKDLGIELGSHWAYGDSYAESLLLL